MDKHFQRLGLLSLILGIAGYVFVAVIALTVQVLSEIFGFVVFGLWIAFPLGAVICAVLFRRIYGKAKNGKILSGMILGCILLWIQLCFLCILFFDAQDWSNAESTALIMVLVPSAAVAVCVALYVSARVRGQSRVESAEDLIAGVSVEGLPGCFAVLSVRNSEWREETVGAYYSEGSFFLRETVRYKISGEETAEKQVDLPAKYAKKNGRKAFMKLLSAEFPEHSFDAKLVSGAYYRMK